MRTLTCAPTAEVLGVNLRAFSDNIQGDALEAIMKKYKFFDIEPMEWYPLNRLLAALNEINEHHNASTNYVAIGMKIGEITPLPPEMDSPSISDVLHIWDDLYQALHRGADVGKMGYEKINDKKYNVFTSIPYPDDMTYGILYAFGKRFLPQITPFTVTYDLDTLARDHGGNDDFTTLNIEWY